MLRAHVTIVASITVALAAVALNRPSQPDPMTRWGELPLRGRVKEISVSPDGRVWLGSAMGELAFAAEPLGDWHLATIPFAADSDSWVGPNIDRISFFNADTAIATGYLMSEPDGDTDQLLRTEDGGRTWHWVDIGADQWVYTVFILPNGKAWIGGSKGDLRTSSDFGKTWTVVSYPFDAEQRLASLWMIDSARGFAGALADQLRATHDGGKTWSPLDTPAGQGLVAAPPDRDSPIDQIVVFQRWLVVRQRQGVFARAVDSTRWRSLTGSATDVVVDRERGRLIAIDTMRQVLVFDSTLVAPTVLGRADSDPQSLAIRGPDVLVLGEGLGITILSPTEKRFGFPLCSATRQANVNAVRVDGERWFGVTDHHLYRSEDSARTWTRLGVSSTPISDFLVGGDGRLLVWNGRGDNRWFDPNAGTWTSADGLDSVDIVGLLARGDQWLAYGGNQTETTRRVDVARTFFSGQFAGTTSYGHIALSRDRGRSWTRIDRWEAGGVAAIFPTSDGVIHAISFLGSVRRLTPTGGGYRAETLIEATEGNRDSVPYVQNLFTLYFPTETDGMVLGDIHHLGHRLYRSGDGGRTWRQDDPSTIEYQRVFPVGLEWVGSTGSRLDLLGARPRTLLQEDCGEDPAWVRGMGEGVTSGCITDVSSAGDDRILVEIRRGRFDRSEPAAYRLVPLSRRTRQEESP